jgi:hypothetical protein
MKNTMKLTYLFLILLLFTFISCDEPVDSNTFRYGEELDLKQHIIYTAEDNLLEIEIDKITDSRCPTGVVCVWQGEARVSIQTKGKSTGKITLSTYNNLTDTLESTWSFRLLDVKPYPVYQQPVDSNKIVITMVIDRIKS